MQLTVQKETTNHHHLQERDPEAEETENIVENSHEQDAECEEMVDLRNTGHLQSPIFQHTYFSSIT